LSFAKKTGRASPSAEELWEVHQGLKLAKEKRLSNIVLQTGFKVVM